MDMQAVADVEDEDGALLVSYRNGELAAARLLTARLAPRILAHATRMLGGDRAEAEDVTQEAMLRLWRIAPEWQQGRARVSTWLYRVAGNLCVDRLRRARPEPLDQSNEPLADDPGAEAGLQNAARLQALYGALAELPARQRQAVVLRHIEGLSNPETARILGTSPEAVESLTARGKRALAGRLAGRKAELGYRDD